MPKTFRVKPKPEVVEAYKNRKIYKFVYGTESVPTAKELAYDHVCGELQDRMRETAGEVQAEHDNTYFNNMERPPHD